MDSFRLSWFAIYTKPRQEHVALVNLERQSFECFLPMAMNPYQRRSTTNAIRREPLFPRYLFLNALPEIQNLATVRSTRGVVGLVRAGLELITVPEYIIAGLKTRMDRDTGLIALDPVPLKRDDNVRIFDGPLVGLVRGIERTPQQDSLSLAAEDGRLGKTPLRWTPCCYNASAERRLSATPQ